MKYTPRLLALAIALAAPAAFAGHDHDDDGPGHGHGRGHAWGHEKHGKHKEEFWEGNCLVKREWKHGELREERKCRPAHEHVRVIPAPPPPPQQVMVYPPWIVQQQGQYMYAPQYRPAPPPPTMAVSRCNSQTVGAVLGGVVGGVLGNQIGAGNGRTLATVGGAVTGVLVGGEIGRRMDARDQGCVGEVLEVAPVGQRVQWVESGTTYVVVPQKVVMRQGAHCRPYTVEMRTPGGLQRSQGVACRRPGGVWVSA